jgi:hypothetical protein
VKRQKLCERIVTHLTYDDLRMLEACLAAHGIKKQTFVRDAILAAIEQHNGTILGRDGDVRDDRLPVLGDRRD